MITLPPFKSFLASNIPSVYDNTLSYYDELTKLIAYLEQQVVPAINKNSEDIEKYLNGLQELKDYVDHYFDNLDVQTEINNKLDEMAESGDLQTIIAQFLSLGPVFGYDTVSDLKAATNLAAGCSAKTLGFYTLNDGGGATYTIRALGEGETANEMDVIAITGTSLVAELVPEIVNVKQFGATGDGTTDDTAFIQRAINYAGEKGSVYFPKDEKCVYLITSPLEITNGYVTLYSEGKAEYYAQIKTSGNITMILVKAPGFKMNGLTLFGNGTDINKSTTNGIRFDRSVVVDEEASSNIDGEIFDCNFFYLNDAIQIKGRNLNVHESGFVICHRGVAIEGYSTYSIRGIRVFNNRFHSLNAYGTDLDDIDDMSSWCVEAPYSNYVKHIEVTGNNCDFCNAGIYKGTLVGCVIDNNIKEWGSSVIALSKNSDQSQYSSFTQSISGNIVSKNDVDSTYPGMDDSFIVIDNAANITIANNTVKSCRKDGIVLSNVFRANVVDNMITHFGVAATTYSAVKLVNATRMNISNNAIMNNITDRNGITADAQSKVFMNANTFDNVETPLNMGVASINSNIGVTAWTLPTLLNSFTASSSGTHRGYRKFENGDVELQISVSGGTDNANAFVLPEGARPKSSFRVPNVCVWQGRALSDGAYALIGADGGVKINFDNNLLEPTDVSFDIRVTYRAN